MNAMDNKDAGLGLQLLDPPAEARDLIRATSALTALAHSDLDPAGRQEATLAAGRFRIEPGDRRSWSSLIELAAPLPEGWLNACLMYPAVSSPFVDRDELAHGSVHRRVDAIYDVLDTDYCAWQVQETYAGVLEQLRMAQNDTSVKIGLQATGIGLAFAGGWFGVGGGPASVAQDWLGDQVARRTPLVFELAEVVTACMVLEEDDATRSALPEIRNRCIDQLHAAAREHGAARSGEGSIPASEAGRRWNLFKNLVGMFEADSNEPVDAPLLIGLPMSTARQLVESNGFEFVFVDGARTQGSERIPWRESSWRVAGQFPMPGAADASKTVAVAVAKFEEKVSETDAMNVARAFHRATTQGR